MLARFFPLVVICYMIAIKLVANVHRQPQIHCATLQKHIDYLSCHFSAIHISSLSIHATDTHFLYPYRRNGTISHVTASVPSSLEFFCFVCNQITNYC